MGRLEGVLPWLPAVLRSANSRPCRRGRDRLTTRAELLELLPRAGAPPVFASYEDWAEFAELLVERGLADDLMRLWWDVRPHPRLGTLEIRMPDQPTRLEATALAEPATGWSSRPIRLRRRPTAASTPRTGGPRRGSAPGPS